MYGHKMRGRGAHPMCMRVTGRVWLDPAAFGLVFLLGGMATIRVKMGHKGCMPEHFSLGTPEYRLKKAS